mmetsp:Transcript_104192/g.336033  ORF Transcript_104192/g.336033 Transcript_104192/m.336033 type:complete len:283 (+) Transcript_104192:52-900(+)
MASRIGLLLLAATFVGASARLKIISPVKPKVELLKIISPAKPKVELDNDCKCIQWKELYKTGVPCGGGLEYFPATGHGAPTEMATDMIGGEFCKKFFTRMENNYCVNIDFNAKSDDWKGQQWCYVSSKCADKNVKLNGVVGGVNALKTKVCNPMHDTLTRWMTPLQLDVLRHSYDIDLGLLAKFAYPVWQGEKWPAVERFFVGTGAVNLLASGVRKDLQKVMEDKERYLFDSPDGKTPFYVVAGKRVWKINQTPGAPSKWLAGDMKHVNEIQCIANCEDEHQ